MSTTETVPSYLPFKVQVTAVRRLSPSFVRITLGGADLLDLDDGGSLGTRDTRVKVVIPATPERPFADLNASDPDWYRNWLALDPSVRGHMRTYTARSARLSAAIPEIDIDFVVHVDERGAGGPATVWATNAQPGERLTVIGPNRHHGEATGFEWRPPAAVRGRKLRVLLAGDETAAPAIAAILETLSDEHAGHAVIEVPTAADIQELEAPSDITVTFLVRGDRARGEQLQAAVKTVVSHHSPAQRPRPDLPVLDVDVDAEILWETPHEQPGIVTGTAEPLYAWIAGEAAVVRDLRRSLVQDHALPREQVAFMGYWRQGRAEG